VFGGQHLHGHAGTHGNDPLNKEELVVVQGEWFRLPALCRGFFL
jgi:hypothetical protein